MDPQYARMSIQGLGGILEVGREKRRSEVELEVWSESIDSEEWKGSAGEEAPPELVRLIEEARRSPTVRRDRRGWKREND